MGYFTSIADQAFKTGPGGERLFFLGGPWSKPLVLKDEQQFTVTYRKHLWMQRCFLTLLILGQPFLLIAIPSVTEKVLGFVSYAGAIMVIQWLTQRIVFRQELAGCKRLPQRMPLSEFYRQLGEQHPEDGLVWRLITCLVFALCGVGIAFGPTQMAPGIGVICSIFFGACGIGWWYALRLKRQKLKADRISHPRSSTRPASGFVEEESTGA